MKNQIVKIILTVIEHENAMRDTPIDCSQGEGTSLYGAGGQLDSMGLVSLIVGVEQELEIELNLRLTLVSDIAMSARRSPFATIGSFADYILALSNEVACV
jgi:acyl carrier protein